MKLAYCMCHYGMPYLASAVESLYDQVDHFVIMYTDKPSQGWHTTSACPDTEEELLNSVNPWMDKITWVSGNWDTEGDHHDAIHRFVAELNVSYDWLVRFDTDEIFPPGTVESWVNQAEKTTAQRFRAPFLHFWRSFNRVCRDGQAPERMLRAHGGEGFHYLDDGYLEGKPEAYRVFHMGYAQPTKYIDYKMEVQAHHAEWRPEWYSTKWNPNAQVDIHPVVFDFWNAEVFDKQKLPKVLKHHPYFNSSLIE